MNAEIFRRIRCCFSNFQRVCDPFFGTVFRSFSELQSEVEKYRPPQTGIIGIAVPRFICGEMDYFGIDDGVEQFIARIQTGKLRIHQQFEQIRVGNIVERDESDIAGAGDIHNILVVEAFDDRLISDDFHHA